MSPAPIPGWQSQSQDSAFSDPSACAARASKLEHQITRRNRREYAAAALVVLLFGAGGLIAAFHGEPLIALSGVLVVAGTALVVRNLHVRASNLDRHPEEPCRVHLRRQYEHQYRFLRSVPLLYIGPLIPGVALFYFAVVRQAAEISGWGSALENAWPKLAVTAAIFAGVAIINWRAAHSVKRKIDGLDALA